MITQALRTGAPMHTHALTSGPQHHTCIVSSTQCIQTQKSFKSCSITLSHSTCRRQSRCCCCCYTWTTMYSWGVVEAGASPRTPAGRAAAPQTPCCCLVILLWNASSLKHTQMLMHETEDRLTCTTMHYAASTDQTGIAAPSDTLK